MSSPLGGRTAADLDFYVVRENNEGEYSEVGGRMYRDTDQEMAMQQAIFTRRNTDRIMRFAFELARSRPKKHLTSAPKSNGLVHTMPFWDERFAAVKAGYPAIRHDPSPLHNLAAPFLTPPQRAE